MKITYINHMGNDKTVVDAARISFNKIKETFDEKDEKLISYLASHKHWSPFSHPQISLHVKAPIFVLRQLLKSVVGLTWNEVSRRYVDSPVEVFIPEQFRERPQNKKQGSGDVINGLTPSEMYLEAMSICLSAYTGLLEEGVAPEMARMVLPLSTYSEGVWTGSLAAFARVYKLRTSEDAQKETQEIVLQLDNIITPLYPLSWKALKEHA